MKLRKKPSTETSLIKKMSLASVMQENCAMNCFTAIWTNGYKHTNERLIMAREKS
jgi:hypothetical protein